MLWLLKNFPTDFPLANLVPFLIFPLCLSQLGFSHRMLVGAGATTHAAAHAWCAHGWKAGRDGFVAKDGGFLSHGVTPKKHLFS